MLQEVDRLRRDNDLPLNGVAVMYRVNSQSRAFEDTCLRFGVPYRLVGGVRFYQRREVKDVITYLRVVNNPHDDISLARIVNAPARGIGQRSLEDLAHWARQRNRSLWEAMQAVVSARSDGGDAPPLASRPAGAIAGFTTLITSLIEEGQRVDIVTLLDDLLERIGYEQYLRSDPDRGEERWENVKELRGVALQYQDWAPGEGLFAFLETVALVTDVDRMDEEERDALTLITLHQAKGLEFPVVFMTGMEEGVLPHMRSMGRPGRNRGGAAADLRGHDPRPGEAVHGAVLPPRVRGGEHAQRPVPLSGRYSGPDHVHADGSAAGRDAGAPAALLARREDRCPRRARD